MSDQSAIEIRYLDPVQQGSTLTEKAVDVHVIDGFDVVARWYHSPYDTDLTMWFDGSDRVSRFQLNSGGQIVDWSLADGLHTGFIVELELGRSKEVAETIQFDAETNGSNVKNAFEILSNCSSLSKSVREGMLESLGDQRVRTGQRRISGSRTRFWSRFKNWTTGR